MASTYSTNLRLELIGTGEQQGTWGSTTNVNLGTLLEEAIGGYVSVTVSDVGDTTLTTANGAADQARNMTLNLTGTISAARNVICPAIEKVYLVKNATTGGFAVTFKVSGQTGISIPNGYTMLVYVDGTDVRQAGISVSPSGVAQIASIELGNNSDTTISRSAAGVIAVEGGVIPKENRANTFTANQIIEVTNNTNAALRITQLGTADAIRVEDSTNPDSTPFVVDASGNVGVGTASPGSNRLRVLRTDDGRVAEFRGNVGQLNYEEYTGLSYLWNANTPLLFGTSSNHYTAFGTNNTERMRIDSSGNLLVGATAADTGSRLLVRGSGTTSATFTAVFEKSDGSDILGIRDDGVLFSVPTYNSTNAGGANMVITSDGRFYRSSSSAKYKKDVENLDTSLVDNAVDNLRPVWYRSIDPQGDDKPEWSHVGLIAEEVALVEPRLVQFRTSEVVYSEDASQLDADGNPLKVKQVIPLSEPEPEGIDYARLSVLLLDKVQRMDATIDALEARIAALEAA